MVLLVAQIERQNEPRSLMTFASSARICLSNFGTIWPPCFAGSTKPSVFQDTTP